MKKMIQKNKAMMVMGGLVCFSGLVDGAEEEKTQVIKLEKSQREEVSKGIAYMKGKELVNDLLKQGFTMEDFSSKAFSEGLSEALNQKASTIKLEDFQVTFNLVKAKLLERELSLSKKNKVKSDQWLSENLKKKGVKTTESGLQYEVIVKGEGKVHSFNKPSQKATEKKRFFIKYLLRNKDCLLYTSPSPRDS